MTARATPFEIRGGHVLAGMLAFFGLIIAINVAFSVIAIRSFPGEDEKRSYLQGLRYNEILAERAAEAALGWRASAGFTAAQQTATVEVRILDRAGAPVNGLTITGRLRRPATTRDDATLVFTPAGPGLYRARAGALAPGAWTLDAHAKRDDAAFALERRLSWPAR